MSRSTDWAIDDRNAKVEQRMALKKSNWPTTSRHARGYGWAWDKLRKRILDRDCHLCQCKHCKTEDRTTLATEVHHVKPKAQGGSDEPENLASMAHDCHVRADAEEQDRQLKARVVIGLDGFPVA